ncbi:MAG: YdcF family protein [Bdellovibrionales bacterium]|nr:YdcF family protein [Bdellovibrionales bacterium]
MRLTTISVIAFFLIIAAALFFSELTKIKRELPTAWTQDHAADCGIVLTGGPSRVREGFDLLAQGNIKKLIISGVHPKAKLREIFPEWPFYGELNENDVILERRSGTTYGNAQQTLVLVEALHCRDVVLITSWLHMHRARATFQSIFPKDFPIQTRAIVFGDLDPSLWEIGIEALKATFYSIWAY